MARSDIVTWLPLDDFAAILGIHPLGFSQLHSNTLQPNTVCGETFFQQSFQHSDRVGRDDIAMAIQQAEQDISREAGFNLMPDWTAQERLAYPRPGVMELYGTGFNPRWQLKSVEAERGYLISGGIKAKEIIQAGAPVTRTDVDSDNYAETATVNVATSITDPNEIHLFYPAQSGEDGWEIRPIKVSISGGNARITFKSWQIAAANKMDALDGEVLDADAASSYETTVDVYRVYNDETTQVQFLWEGGPDCCGSCVACQLGAQEGCMHFRDPRLGVLVPAAASWNSETSEWDGQNWSACREPDQVRLWYYSGFQDLKLARPKAELTPFWKYAIAYYAASKFERPVCGCSNVNQFIEKWRMDAAFASEQAGSFTMTSELAANRLGTSMGALYAYRALQRNGVRVNK